MEKDQLHATAVLPPATLKYGDGWPSQILCTCGQKKKFCLPQIELPLPSSSLWNILCTKRNTLALLGGGGDELNNVHYETRMKLRGIEPQTPR